MNTKPINFRTKTQNKSKSTSLSQQFVKIERVLTQYEKKKFHPKIDNFNYISSQTIVKQSQKKKFLLKKDKDSLSCEKVFGPLPEIFTKPKTNRITQKSYDITQITLASSQQKQTYVKMSKIRNHQKRRKLLQAYPKYTQKYIETINQNLIELLGRQMQLANSLSSREDLSSYEQKQSIDFHNVRSDLETKTQTQLQPLCKKYAEIQIDELLQNNTKLTMSQKRRITEYKKRNQTPQPLSPMDCGFKRHTRIYRKDKTLVMNSDYNDSSKSFKQNTLINNNNLSQIEDDERLDFSNKGWIIAQQCDSNIITI